MRGLLVALAAIVALASAPAAQAAKPCKPRPRHHTVQTLAANDRVRVYKVAEPPDFEGLEAFGDVYACERATGWRRKLGVDGAYFPDGFDVRAVVEGDLVAYSYACNSCREHYRFPVRVSVLDMSTHHHTFVYAHADRNAFATDLVLKPNGSVAWISYDRLTNGDFGYVVRRHDPGGTADLDEGRKVGPESLTLDPGSVLHWTHGGEQRAAPLG